MQKQLNIDGVKVTSALPLYGHIARRVEQMRSDSLTQADAPKADSRYWLCKASAYGDVLQFLQSLVDEGVQA